MRGRQAQTTNLAQDGTASYESSAILESLSKTFPLENPNERVSYGGELKDVPRDQLALFYRNDRNNVIGHVFTVLPNCVDLPGTPEQLDVLIAACHEASFGRGGEAILDESYRKALRLDIENFGINFSPDSLGLIQTVRDALLGPEDTRILRAELYKLNVYTEGGFFKAHQDTPRGEDMIGSLVIGLPAAHQGGALIVRNRFGEMKHDMSNDGSDTTVRWAAFYSTTEHEVETVTSGHRITITYNLFVEKKKIKEEKFSNSAEEIAQDNLQKVTFYRELAQQLQNQKFYPKGGILGFGLEHAYPFSSGGSSDLNSMINYLKSNDNVLRNIGVTLGLKTELKYVVHLDFAHGVTVMTSEISDPPVQYDEDPLPVFVNDWDSEVIEDLNNDLEEYKLDAKVSEVDWVTGMNDKNNKRWEWQSYGNEPSIEFTYGSCALIMRIPEWSEKRGFA